MEASLAYKTKQIIKKYEFNFKKNFGQNFLVDERVLDKIVNAADINENDLVIEVGPGIGDFNTGDGKKGRQGSVCRNRQDTCAYFKGAFS